jgi:hypothetical protein
MTISPVPERFAEIGLTLEEYNWADSTMSFARQDQEAQECIQR